MKAKLGVVIEDLGDGEVRIEGGSLNDSTPSLRDTPVEQWTPAMHIFRKVAEVLDEVVKEREDSEDGKDEG